MNRVVVFGSRTFPAVYERHVFDRIAALPADWIVVHGACRTGADAFADRAARQLGRTVEPYPANWDEYGPAAGPYRNQEMAALPELVLGIGFRMPGRSNGTDGMRRLLDARGVQVERYGWDWAP